jgi:hypothetical protein
VVRRGFDPAPRGLGFDRLLTAALDYLLRRGPPAVDVAA